MRVSQKLLFTAGRPFSPIYSLLMTTRQLLYEKGLFKHHQLPVPIISVGNLTMGGTGKTPTVAFIANLLQNTGYRPAIISRGYGGTAQEEVNLVANRSELLLNALQAGDEPFMLARQLPGIPVLTGKKRIHPCRYAIEQLQCDILLLDDGFQHLSVTRDIDLVLFNATSLAGNSRVFPGGELREPVSALKRCTAFILTGVDKTNQARADRFSQLLQSRFPGKPVFCSSLKGKCINGLSGNEASIHSPIPFPLYAFCGIAHPERFRATLAENGYMLSGNSDFSDHYPYRQSDMDFLCHEASRVQAKGLVTTEKDLVKVEKFKRTLPLYYLKAELNPEISFINFLQNKIHSSVKPIQ